MDRWEPHLKRRGVWYVAGASLLYFGLTASIASLRPLWYDELFTFHVARQGRVGDVLRALAQGADVHPPLDYLLRHWSMALFGPGELADRLPSVLAFWVMCLALRRFIAVRCGAVLGMVGFVAPWSTLAYEYAYEGRGYAVMLAGSVLALEGWQRALDDSRRKLSLAVLALGVATAVNAHYYGFLVLIPLVAGEATRTVARRRVDKTVWVVIFGAASCVLVNWPFLKTQLAQVGTFWNQASMAQTIDAYWWLLSRGVVALVLFLLFASFVSLLDGPSAHERRERPPVPAHEQVAAVAMLGVPVTCYVIGRIGPGVFYYRYMLLTTVGAILAAAFVAHELLPDDPRWPAVLLAAVALGGTYQMVKTQREFAVPDAGRAGQAALESLLPREELPIVHGTRSGFMDATRYGDPVLFPRMFYLTNREASQKWVGNDNGQIAMSRIAPLVPGQVLDYRRFLDRHQRFLLVNPRMEKDWIYRQLLEDGARISTRAVTDTNLVLEVDVSAVGRSEPAGGK